MNKLVEKSKELLATSRETTMEVGNMARFANDKYEIMADTIGTFNVYIRNKKTQELLFQGNEFTPDEENQNDVLKELQDAIDGKKTDKKEDVVEKEKEPSKEDVEEALKQTTEAIENPNEAKQVIEESSHNDSPFAGIFGGHANDDAVTPDSSTDTDRN